MRRPSAPRLFLPLLLPFLLASLARVPPAGAQAPCPDARPPCDAVCCAAAEVCRFGQCVAPGEPCELQDDCPQGSYCDPVLEAGLSRDAPPPCEYRPPLRPVRAHRAVGMARQ